MPGNSAVLRKVRNSKIRMPRVSIDDPAVQRRRFNFEATFMEFRGFENILEKIHKNSYLYSYKFGSRTKGFDVAIKDREPYYLVLKRSPYRNGKANYIMTIEAEHASKGHLDGDVGHLLEGLIMGGFKPKILEVS